MPLEVNREVSAITNPASCSNAVTTVGTRISRPPTPTSQMTATTSTSGSTHDPPVTGVARALEPATIAAAVTNVGPMLVGLTGGVVGDGAPAGRNGGCSALPGNPGGGVGLIDVEVLMLAVVRCRVSGFWD